MSASRPAIGAASTAAKLIQVIFIYNQRLILDNGGFEKACSEYIFRPQEGKGGRQTKTTNGTNSDRRLPEHATKLPSQNHWPPKQTVAPLPTALTV